MKAEQLPTNGAPTVSCGREDTNGAVDRLRTGGVLRHIIHFNERLNISFSSILLSHD